MLMMVGGVADAVEGVRGRQGGLKRECGSASQSDGLQAGWKKGRRGVQVEVERERERIGGGGGYDSQQVVRNKE